MLILILVFFFGCAEWRVGSEFPHWGFNAYSPQWKRGVLTTGPPRKSPDCWLVFLSGLIMVAAGPGVIFFFSILLDFLSL